MFKLLILEDDADTREEMQDFFRQEGFDVHAFSNKKAFEARFFSLLPHVVILDINLPDGDGFSVASFVRENSSAGIIIVSGRHETIDKVVGLEVGADDYLTKPYVPRELLARVRAQLRRAQKREDAIAQGENLLLRFEGWVIDGRSRVVTRQDGIEVEFTTAEFELLYKLAMNSNHVMARETLMNHLKNNRNWANDERTIDGLVSRLRKKIGDNTIKTIRNVGYLFTPQVEKVREI